MQVVSIQRRQIEPFYLRAISFDIEAHHNFQPGTFRAHPPQITKYLFVTCGNRAQQTSPRKVDVNLAGYFVELGRQRLNGRLNEENVGQLGFAMNAFGDFLQRPTVRVDADEQSFRIAARRVVNEETVSGPDVDSDSALVTLVRSNQLLESSPVDLSEGFAAD